MTVRMAWTVVTRAARGRYLHPVANVPTDLGWHGAVEAAEKVFAARPDLDVWYVPAADSPGQWPEDIGNVLWTSNDGKRSRRIPIRWDSAPQFDYATTEES